MSFGPNVDSAMRDAAVEVDDRGLMALDLARVRVAAVTAFDKGDARDIRGVHVLDSDLLWAALLSLDDAAEFCAAATRLAWRHMPRGRDNVAPVERYGAGVLPWLESRVRDGVLINAPWCVGPCLLALADDAALALVSSLRGYRDRVEMLAWTVTTDGDAAGDPDDEEAAAARLVKTWMATHRKVARPAGELSVGGILAVLDAATAQSWPEFNYAFDGRQEFFALRVIGVRERNGDGWGVILERLGGSYPDSLWCNRFCYGSAIDPDVELDGNVCVEIEVEPPEEGHLFHGGVIRGPAGELRLDEGMIDQRDLRPGKCCEIGYHSMRALAIRTYLTYFPGSLWPDCADAVPLLGLDTGEVIVVTDSFAHVIGPYQREGVPEGDWQIAPSESPTFQSLAEAIIHRDTALFVPGEPTTDWRLHAYVDEPVQLPWLYSRVDPTTLGERGHLRAAMVEASVDVDDRGLMPLADARAVVAAAEVFTKGAGRAIGDRWVQDSDRLWAALLSLADGDDFAAAMARLRWDQPPRGADTLAPVQRHGAAALPWLRAMVRDRVLTVEPPCLRANLLALAAPGVVDLLLDLDGVTGEGDGSLAVQFAELRAAYLAAHPTVAAVRLAERAVDSHAACTLLRQWALLEDSAAATLGDALGADRAAAALAAAGVAPTLSADHVLARLDHHAARPPSDLDAWPRFVHGTTPAAEYHALRLIAARRDADWVVVLERVTGYGHSAKIRRFVYGRGVGAPGRREDLDLAIDWDALEAPAIDGAELLCEAPDYWTGPDGARRTIAKIRAALAARPEQFFIDPAIVVAAAGLPLSTIVATTTALAHAAGPELVEGSERKPWHVEPSASVAYRTVAAAIAASDPALFDPGEPCTDWRLHVAPMEEAAAEEEDSDEDEEEDSDET